MEAIKPVYEDLTKMDLLERCLGAQTQNANESFNSTVWRMAPKAKFSGNVVVETASSIAVGLFNEGHNTLLAIMEELSIVNGEHSTQMCHMMDAKRMASADKKCAAATKEARIEMRRARLVAQDAAIHEKGTLYGPGIDLIVMWLRMCRITVNKLCQNLNRVFLETPFFTLRTRSRPQKLSYRLLIDSARWWQVWLWRKLGYLA